MTSKKLIEIREAIDSVSGDTTSMAGSSSSGLIGKSAGGDFTAAYLAATTITLGVSPYTHTYIADDITAVIQINTSGSVVATYTRDDVAMTLAASVLTVTGAVFATTDTFVVYTNIPRERYTGNDTSTAPYSNATVINPPWAHVLDEANLSAVATTGAGTAIDTSTYGKLVVSIVATSVTTGGTFTFQGSPDGTNWATLASTDSSATSATTQAISVNGTYIYEIDVDKVKQFRINLTARTDGVYTAYVWG